jgi:hypothetical protein
MNKGCRKTQQILGPHHEQFEEVMVKEIKELEEHQTWTTIARSQVPKTARVLPSTWAFHHIKRYPDG